MEAEGKLMSQKEVQRAVVHTWRLAPGAGRRLSQPPPALPGPCADPHISIDPNRLTLASILFATPNRRASAPVARHRSAAQ